MSKCRGIFDLAGKSEEIIRLEKQLEEPGLWDNPDKAKAILKKIGELKAWVQPYKDLQSRFSAIKEIFPEVKKSGELVEEIGKELSSLEDKVKELEMRKLFSKEFDAKGCFLSINAGAGGTESCDWVSMLARMYERWAFKKGWKVAIIDKVDGEVAGLKSVTFRFEGDFAYGYSKSERGVHRLVRISPFDSNARRHTSFASVDVSPIVDDEIEIEIKPEELKVDTFRSSGAGGQHVNVTDSAVRVTHLPSGITVSSQSERSQVQNKETCLKILKSRLYEERQREQDEKLRSLSGEKKEIAWGSQIRSYTFQPYTLVKDARTKFESYDIQKVMDGEIDNFVYAYLKSLEG